MGISSRDYFRDDDFRPSQSGWLSDTPTVRWIISATIIVFLLQVVLVTRGPVPGMPWVAVSTSLVDQWFAMDVSAVLQGQVWRLLSYAFLHDRDNLWHIAMNMLILWFFGCTLERMYTSREFLLFYLAAAIFAAVGYTLIALATGTTAGRMVGASGAVMAVFMLYGIHYPRQRVWVWFIPVEIRFLLAFYVIVDAYPMLRMLAGDPVHTGVAHAAHLAGLLFGWLYYRQQWRLDRLAHQITGNWVANWRRHRARNRLKVYAPTVEDAIDIESEVDRILAKIHEQGSESLTERERSVLNRASEEYKRKL